MKGFKKRFGSDAPTAWLLLAPNFIIAAIFTVFAIVYSVYLSFHDVDLFGDTATFIGLKNYTESIGDPLFVKMLGNTFIFVLFTVPIGMFISLIAAVLLNQSIKGRMFIRGAFFLPTILPIVAIAQVWIWIYEPTYGLLNYFLQAVGISDPSNPIMWLSSPKTAMMAVVIFSIWKSFGYNMIIYLAALQGISRQLYEAADIDGANGFQKFFHITVPDLRPATFFVLITSINGSFQAFDQIYVLTQGGPLHSTNVIAYYIYQYAFEYFEIGRGAAVSLLMFVILFAVAIWQWKGYQTKEED